MERTELLETLVARQEELINHLKDEVSNLKADVAILRDKNDDILGKFINIAEYVGVGCTTEDAIKYCIDAFWEQQDIVDVDTEAYPQCK